MLNLPSFALHCRYHDFHSSNCSTDERRLTPGPCPIPSSNSSRHRLSVRVCSHCPNLPPYGSLLLFIPLNVVPRNAHMRVILAAISDRLSVPSHFESHGCLSAASGNRCKTTQGASRELSECTRTATYPAWDQASPLPAFQDSRTEKRCQLTAHGAQEAHPFQEVLILPPSSGQ